MVTKEHTRNDGAKVPDAEVVAGLADTLHAAAAAYMNENYLAWPDGPTIKLDVQFLNYPED